MKVLKYSSERGYTNTDWLRSYHTFSFDRYQDKRWKNFHSLRVINEDYIAPDSGFGTHSHDNMEIVTYVTSGELEHKDSTGSSGVIKSGEIQRMSAGSGIQHSEVNPSKKNSTQLLQIWFFPKNKDIKPGYEQKKIPEKSKNNQLKLIVSEKGEGDSLSINQNVNIYACVLDTGKKLDFEVKKDRAVWLQIVEGEITVDNTVLISGDGMGIDEAHKINLQSIEKTEFLLFDMQQAS
jgi:redox-sensitive bicupin YhaK (pirin superfamily)